MSNTDFSSVNELDVGDFLLKWIVFNGPITLEKTWGFVSILCGKSYNNQPTCYTFDMQGLVKSLLCAKQYLKSVLKRYTQRIGESFVWTLVGYRLFSRAVLHAKWSQVFYISTCQYNQIARSGHKYSTYLHANITK